MMELQTENCYDDEIEEGEISSDDVYTPLQRPSNNSISEISAKKIKVENVANINNSLSVNNEITEANMNSPLSTCHQMQEALEDDYDSQADSSDTSSGDSSDNCLKKISHSYEQNKLNTKRRKRVRRTVMVRVSNAESADSSNAIHEKRKRFKKNNIWTNTLQEDSLTENMRECEVARTSGFNDRNVENYDISLKYRLNGENCLKRRLSNSTDDFSDSDLHQMKKRGRQTNQRDVNDGNAQRRSVKSRLGYRNHHHHHHHQQQRKRRGSSPTSGSDNSYEPRLLEDLDEIKGREPADIAHEIAFKLKEKTDDLFIRIVEVLGIDFPIEIYKQTQRIEADGGMSTVNGIRRRTSGGVYLYVLKNHERLTPLEIKLIFTEKTQSSNKYHKKLKNSSRDRKVEELKKRLNEQEKDLPALSTRSTIVNNDLEIQAGNLSNPPPSPVGQDTSPEYKAHAINHDTNDIQDKPSTSAASTLIMKDLISYDDDLLDINCGEMDFL